jgi:hypothetical protein
MEVAFGAKFVIASEAKHSRSGSALRPLDCFAWLAMTVAVDPRWSIALPRIGKTDYTDLTIPKIDGRRR